MKEERRLIEQKKTTGVEDGRQEIGGNVEKITNTKDLWESNTETFRTFIQYMHKHTNGMRHIPEVIINK